MNVYGIKLLRKRYHERHSLCHESTVITENILDTGRCIFKNLVWPWRG